MSKPADFMVVLRQDASPKDIEMFFPVTCTYTLGTGTVGTVIWCKEVDFSHPSYLVVEALRHDEEGTTDMHLPHWLILTVVGSKNSPPVGFVWAEEESPLQPKVLEE